MRLTSFVAIAAIAALPALASDIRTETVHFKTGESGATIRDTITGYESVAYELGAGEGQSMVVTMTASNPSAYFNVYIPGKGPGDEAMFIGSTEGNRFEGSLPASGNYTITVYLYRNAARRNDVADYTLDIGID